MHLQELGLPWLAQLLVCVFKYLFESAPSERARWLPDLRRLPILPLMDGSITSMDSSSSSGGGGSSSLNRATTATPPLQPLQQQQQQQQQQAPLLPMVFFPLPCAVCEASEHEAVAESSGEAEGNSQANGQSGSGGGSSGGGGSEDVSAGVNAVTDSIYQGGARGAAKARGLDTQKLLQAAGLDWRHIRVQMLHPDLFKVRRERSFRVCARARGVENHWDVHAWHPVLRTFSQAMHALLL